MSILWCGGEDIDFPNGTGAIAHAIGGRTGYARCALYSDTTGASRSNAFSAQTSLWLGSRCNIPSAAGTGRAFLGVCESDSSGKGIYYGAGSANNKWAIYTWNGTTLTRLAEQASGTLTATTFAVSMEIVDYGETGTINLYVNGSLEVTYSGDIRVSGVASLSAVALGNSTINYAKVSEIIISTTDTRNMSLVTLYPNAAGDTLDWTGAYTTVDEVTLDDADLAYDNTDGHQAMYNLSATPAGSFSVLAVKEAVRACRASDSTPTSLDIGVKSGGSVDVADNHALGTAWDTFERLMTVNPVTSNPFTTGECDALQMVLESEA